MYGNPGEQLRWRRALKTLSNIIQVCYLNLILYIPAGLRSIKSLESRPVRSSMSS